MRNKTRNKLNFLNGVNLFYKKRFQSELFISFFDSIFIACKCIYYFAIKDKDKFAFVLLEFG